jgi:hypothetical protein
LHPAKLLVGSLAPAYTAAAAAAAALRQSLFALEFLFSGTDWEVSRM